MRSRKAPRHVELDARRRWRITTATTGLDLLSASVDYARARLADEPDARRDTLARLLADTILGSVDTHLGRPS